jgi:hypothetical protein
MIRLAAPIAALVALIAAPASAYTAANSLHVLPSGAASFSVPYGGDSAPAAFWCAAGDYVTQVLGKPAETPIYRTSPVPRHTGQGVDFSLDQAASTGNSGLFQFMPDNGAVTAGLARNFCLNRR